MKRKKKVVWLVPFQFKNDYQFYREWITEAWKRQGGKLLKGIDLSWNIRLLIGKSGLAFSLPPFLKNDKALIVCCGGFPDYMGWPYMYRYEIIPIIWDCWPEYQNRLLHSLKRNKIKTVFCTSSQTVRFIQENTNGINAYWLPEGIDVNSYPFGKRLSERHIDVLELGRKMQVVHDALLNASFHSSICHVYQKGEKLLFPDFESLKDGLSDAKITICYPRCDTHPEMAGDIETLTQRYWECMLSGTLIAGRAPQELIDFCGYNPVITLDDKEPAEQLKSILSNIDQYQELADRNRKFAEENTSWNERIQFVRECLSKHYCMD